MRVWLEASLGPVAEWLPNEAWAGCKNRNGDRSRGIRARLRAWATKVVAETKADDATERGRQNGYPLAFTTEKEE